MNPINRQNVSPSSASDAIEVLVVPAVNPETIETEQKTSSVWTYVNCLYSEAAFAQMKKAQKAFSAIDASAAIADLGKKICNLFLAFLRIITFQPAEEKPLSPDELLVAALSDHYENFSAAEIREQLQEPNGLKIVTLHIEDKRLRDLPAEIALLPLQELSVPRNKFTKIPPVIFELKSTLTELDISDNGLKSVSEKINLLQQLSYLNISSNNIGSLPHALGEVPQLGILHAERNALTHIPEVICPQLTSLCVEKNRLKTLPPTIGQWSELVDVNCTDNQITYLPKELGNLKNVRVFNFSYNKIKELPQELSQCENLGYLNVSNNALRSIPHELFTAQSLTSVSFAHNYIKTFPNISADEKVSPITNLDISFNPIQACPLTFLSSLPHLKQLILDQEQLRRWDNDLASLKRQKRGLVVKESEIPQ